MMKSWMKRYKKALIVALLCVLVIVVRGLYEQGPPAGRKYYESFLGNFRAEDVIQMDIWDNGKDSSTADPEVISQVVAGLKRMELGDEVIHRPEDAPVAGNVPLILTFTMKDQNIYKMTFYEFGIFENGHKPEHFYYSSLDGNHSANGIWRILYPESP